MSNITITCNKLTPIILGRINDLAQTRKWPLDVSIELCDPSSASPVPWDCWIDIQGPGLGRNGKLIDSQLILEGSAGPSGYGYCKVAVPLDEATDYRVKIDGDSIPEDILALKD